MKLLSLLFYGLVFYILLVYILDPAPNIHFPSVSPWLLIIMLSITGFIIGRINKLDLTQKISEEDITGINAILISIIFGVVLITSLGNYKWFFFENHQIYRQIFAISILLTIIIVIIPSLWRWIIILLFIIAVIYIAYGFLTHTECRMIYKDDHTSFAYRMLLFRESFPSLHFYNPGWNGGYSGKELLTTGVLSFCYLLFPLVMSFDPVKLYTPALAIIFIGIIPSLYYFALRAIKVDKFGAACGAILSIGVSRYFFISLLSWGVGPSLLSSALLPIIFTLLYRSFILEFIDIPTGFALLITAILASFWPGVIFMFIPVIVGFFICLSSLNLKKIRFGIIILILYLVIITPWLLDILKYGDISQFSNLRGTSSLHPDIKKALGAMGYIKFINPIILMLGLGELYITKDRYLKHWMIIILILYLLLIGFGNQYKPQFQFYRVSIPFAFFLIIPSSIFIGKILNLPQKWIIPVKSLIIATLIVSIINISQLYKGKGKEKYHTIPKDVYEMVNWIEKNTSKDGRILFAGRTVHAYGWAHVAILPYMTEREMMAKDFYHFDLHEIGDYDLRPVVYRGNISLTEKYFDLYNVSHIISFDPKWIKLFRNYPYLYKEEISFKDKFGTGKVIFSRINWKPNWFIEGRGRIYARVNRIQVHLGKETPIVVLKYNWVKDLYTLPKLSISPYILPGGIKFISVETKGITDFEIRFK
jgi:hypothetical protein